MKLIGMAVFTNISKEFIKNKLIYIYKINLPLKIKGIKEGTTNSNFIIKTKTDQFITTIFENIISKETLIFHVKIINFLFNNGIKCPKISTNTSGKLISKYKKKFLIITNRLKKTKIKKTTYTNSFNLGKCIATIHKIGKKFPINKKNETDIIFITNEFQKIKNKLTTKHSKILSREIKKHQIYTLSKNYQKLPSGFCHCDLFKDNIFFNKKKPTGIFDFYFSCTEKYLLDISIIINEWFFKKNKIKIKKVKYFLIGYNSVRKINDLEKKEVINILRLSAMRFLITRINNFLNNRVPNKTPQKYKNILQKCITNSHKVQLIILKTLKN